MIDTSKLCANGRAGYTIESGDMYAPKSPCPNLKVLGHVLCDTCREASGGYRKIKVVSPTRTRYA